MEAIFKHILIPNWIIFICLLAFFILVLAKRLGKYHFANFIWLFATDKYVKINNNKSSKSLFHWMLTLFHFVIVPLVALVSMKGLEYVNEFDFWMYIKLGAFYILYCAIKYILEKIAVLFHKSKGSVLQYFYEKQTYKNYLTVLCYPILLFIFFNFSINKVFVLVFLGILLILALLSFILILMHNRVLFYEASVYFILYLCTIQIVPYILIYNYLKGI